MGQERGERYTVEVGFLRGRPSALVIATLTLYFGTAGNFIHNFYVLMSLTVEHNSLLLYIAVTMACNNLLFF